MKKRAQLTIYIVMGFILVICFMIFYYLMNSQPTIEQSSTDLIPELTSINLFVDSCLKNTIEKAVYTIGVRGGYTSDPPLAADSFLFSSTAYFYYEGENKIPQLSVIEDEISNYVSHNLPNCINNFSEFKDSGVEIMQSPIISETMVKDNVVQVDINYPLTLNKGQQKRIISKFTQEYPVRLKLIYETSNKMIKEQLLYPNVVCISCISKITDDTLFSIEKINFGDTIYFVIIDDKSIVLDMPYRFVFANKYDLK
tara:strand:- start:7366 stop:8130 length:765 start_codon:yes stop_codon:yes gene_type:complete